MDSSVDDKGVMDLGVEDIEACVKGGLKRVRLHEGPGGLKALPPTLLASDIATK